MWHTVLALPILAIVASQEPATPSPGTKHNDPTSKPEAAHDSANLVQRALRCEARGDADGRRAALKEAVRVDPENPRAHGLLGEVSCLGRWEPLEAVGRRMKEDPAQGAMLAEYDARRAHIDDLSEYEEWEIDYFEKRGGEAQVAALKVRHDHEVAKKHVKLGIWCESRGLKPEARAHFTTAVLLNPHDEVTWRHLGYTRHRGRWMTHAQVASDRREAMAQRHADRHWEPLLRKWAARLADPDRRDDAEVHLAKVSDPRAVPSIARVFGNGPAVRQLVAVRLLERIDAPASTSRLARLAIDSDAPDVRQAAARALRGREPRDYAERLVDMIRPPLTYEMQPVNGPGTEGSLVIDTPRYRMTRTYEAPPAFRLAFGFSGYVGYDMNGLPIVLSYGELGKIENDFIYHLRRRDLIDAETRIRAAEVRTAAMLATAQVRAEAARRRLAADVRDLEEAKDRAGVLNPRIKAALQTAMDAPARLAEDDADAWHSWYYERIGYRYTPPPKVYAAVNAMPSMAVPEILSCFAAGTPVRTLDGPRPIESLRCGDRVLSQDVATGALAFRPVVAVHHNPPDETLRIAMENGDAVVASRFHRFWRVGQGWAMARDLKPGDVLRTLAGIARIDAVEQGPVQPVFNLDVDGSRTYFVGSTEMLVHDNTLPPPHPDEAPFDAVSPVAGASGPGRDGLPSR